MSGRHGMRRATAGGAGVEILGPENPDPATLSVVGKIQDNTYLRGGFLSYGGGGVVFATSMFGDYLTSVDFSDPTQPVVVDHVSTRPSPRGVHADGSGRIAVTYHEGWLDMYDGSDPSTLSLEGSLRLSFYTEFWGYPVIVGDVLYAGGTGSTEEGLYSVDISDPSNPVELDHLRGGSSGIDEISVEGNYLYAWGPSGFQVFDISDPENLLLVGTSTVPTATWGRGCWKLSYSDYVIVVDRNGTTSTIIAFDVSDPTNPVFVSRNNVQWAEGLWVDEPNQVAYVIAMKLFDLDDLPSTMPLIGEFTASGWGGQTTGTAIPGHILAYGYDNNQIMVVG